MGEVGDGERRRGRAAKERLNFFDPFSRRPYFSFKQGRVKQETGATTYSSEWEKRRKGKGYEWVKELRDVARPRFAVFLLRYLQLPSLSLVP